MTDERGRAAAERLAGTRFGAVRWVGETGSTNADLLAAAAAGEPDGLVLVADHQHAGRGRLERSWVAPPGASLLVSVLLRPALAPDDAFLAAHATGVAAVEACRQVAGWAPGIKWPNDLVVGGAERHAGRKLAGILAESRLAGGRLEALVVGMGLNVTWQWPIPGELADTAVALNHLVDGPVDRVDLLVAWLAELDRWLGVLGDGVGRDRLLEAVRERSATLGHPVRVELPGGEELLGDAVDLTDEGHLVVAPDDGRPTVEVTVGDVVHLRPR